MNMQRPDDRLKLMWLAYLTVAQAAHIISDPTEKSRMWDRANRRLDVYFLELEKEVARHDPVPVHPMRRSRGPRG